MSQNIPSEKDVILALALASGTTTIAAADQADVCRKSVSRRLSDPEFRKLVIEYRDGMVAKTLGKMAADMTPAADAPLFDNDDVKVRLRAARAGMSTAETRSDFPYLTDEDLRACLAFTAERERWPLQKS